LIVVKVEEVEITSADLEVVCSDVLDHASTDSLSNHISNFYRTYHS
jgi:hypothetical protein